MVSNHNNDVAQTFGFFNSKIKKTAEYKGNPYFRRGINQTFLFHIAKWVDVFSSLLRFAQIEQVQDNGRNIN